MLGESLACPVPPEQPREPGKERCIAQQFLCDGHNDCQTGYYLSDEFGCGKSAIKTFKIR